MPQCPEQHAVQTNAHATPSSWHVRHGEVLDDWKSPGDRMPLELVAALSMVRRACMGAALDTTQAELLNVALHVAVSVGIAHNLLPALNRLQSELAASKAGTPCTESAANLDQLARACDAISKALPFAHQLSLSTSPLSGDSDTKVARALSRTLNLPLVVAPDKVTSLTSLDTLLSLHGTLKLTSLALMNIAAAMCTQAHDAEDAAHGDALAMVCCQVLGREVAMTIGVATGQFEDRPFKPLLAQKLLQSIRLLTDATTVFTEFAVCRLDADGECRSNASGLASSLMLATSRSERTDGPTEPITTTSRR